MKTQGIDTATPKKQLLDLVKKGKLLSELKDESGLNGRQLALKLNFLETNGYQIERVYTDGIGPKIFLSDRRVKKGGNFILRPNSDKIRFLVISDTHLGRKDDRLDLLDNVYDYAAKQGISSVLHLGDLIEGYSKFVNNEDLAITDAEEIAEYVAEKYPEAGSIMSYILLGNHDYRTIREQGLDIRKFISRVRPDMAFVGYKNAKIDLYKDRIGLQHQVTKTQVTGEQLPQPPEGSKSEEEPLIYLRGHTHRSCLYMEENKLVVCAPALCNTNESPPGAWDMTLNFNEQKEIDNVKLSSLVVKPKAVRATAELHHKVERLRD